MLKDAVIDEELQDILKKYPELRSITGKLDSEEQPVRYTDFVAKVLKQVLREEPDPGKRLSLCNVILEQLGFLFRPFGS